LLAEDEVTLENDFSMIMEKQEDASNIAIGRTFFCSELVAKCFKVCKVMENV
jgi:hypothetical protein